MANLRLDERNSGDARAFPGEVDTGPPDKNTSEEATAHPLEATAHPLESQSESLRCRLARAASDAEPKQDR